MHKYANPNKHIYIKISAAGHTIDLCHIFFTNLNILNYPQILRIIEAGTADCRLRLKVRTYLGFQNQEVISNVKSAFNVDSTLNMLKLITVINITSMIQSVTMF